jgi:2,3-dihydroxy-p-cumate/2,3-dihydroxybenzoate 3,4-dioxygenase
VSRVSTFGRSLGSRTVIELCDIRYVRLGTRKLAEADRFAREIIGLELSRREGTTCHYRSDAREHTLVYFEGDPSDHVVGFEVRGQADLESAFDVLAKAGCKPAWGDVAQCDSRRVRAMLAFSDPTGNRIELVHGAQHLGTRHQPSRDSGVTGFSHIGLCSTDPRRDERFWTDTLGARVSDRIGDAPLLRIDPIHHKVALFPTQRSGIQHVNHQVSSIDDLMRAWYLLQRRSVRVVFGPGRHPTSGAKFLYFEGPDGMVFEYSTGVRSIAPEEESSHRPRQFPVCNESFCEWGSVPDIAEFRAKP